MTLLQTTFTSEGVVVTIDHQSNKVISTDKGTDPKGEKLNLLSNEAKKAHLKELSL